MLDQKKDPRDWLRVVCGVDDEENESKTWAEEGSGEAGLMPRVLRKCK